MIEITQTLSIDEDELVERFVRASGPGGQRVNKTSSAVELRFNAMGSPSLPEGVRERLKAIAGQRMTQDGWIVIQAQEHASQLLNREAAVARLVDLIQRATVVPKRRKKTKPTYASKLKRLEGKAKRSGVKAMRGRPDHD